MSVEITTLDVATDADEWNRYVERSPETTPFYRAEALELQAAYADSNVTAYVGFKGQEAVGLFPIFEYRKGPFSAAFSPAPRSWVSYLGPARCNVEKLKRRKRDRRNKRFVEGCLERLEDDVSPIYARFVTGEYGDVRPFDWNGFDVRPGYTYVVPLDGSESDLLERFSSDARSNVRDAESAACVVREGDGDTVERIVERVRDRYESQGESFHLDASFARDLYEVLPEGAIRPYACLSDGEFLGGILVFESDDTRYRWLGGVKPDAEVDVAINDYLDWRVLQDALEDGFDRYDLVGAGVPSINRYKAKFDPALETHYTITRGSFGIDHLVGRFRKRS